MVSLSFRDPQATLVASGAKTLAVRPYRHPLQANPVPGDRISLFANQFTRHERIIGEATCTAAIPVELLAKYIEGGVLHQFDGEIDTPTDEIARSEGFDDKADMLSFYAQHFDMPFKGLLVRWGKVDLAEEPTSCA